MRKKELMNGRMNIYAVYDKIAKKYVSLYTASTDEEMIRKNLPAIILSIPLRDLIIYHVGYFYEVTFECKLCTKKVVSTNKYLFTKHSLSPTGENESLENIEKAINDVKSELIANKEKETEINE